MAESEERVCQFCRHWHRVKATLGECRAKSPTTTISVQSDEAVISNKGVWPKTFRQEWCSEFEKRPENVPAVGNAIKDLV